MGSAEDAVLKPVVVYSELVNLEVLTVLELSPYPAWADAKAPPLASRKLEKRRNPMLR